MRVGVGVGGAMGAYEPLLLESTLCTHEDDNVPRPPKCIEKRGASKEATCVGADVCQTKGPENGLNTRAGGLSIEGEGGIEPPG